QHAVEAPKPLSRLNPEIGTEINAVVMRALEKDPDKRYRSAIEIATEFELACRSAAVSKKSLPTAQIERENDEVPLDFTSRTRRIDPSVREPLPFNPGLAKSSTVKEESKPDNRSREPVNFSFERFVG